MQAFLGRRLNFARIPAVIEVGDGSHIGWAKSAISKTCWRPTPKHGDRASSLIRPRAVHAEGRTHECRLECLVVHRRASACSSRCTSSAISGWRASSASRCCASRSASASRCSRRIGRAPDHTEYVIAALPLGGYVKHARRARRRRCAPADLPRSFTRKPPWQRILVLLAGPGVNIVFAILVLWGMFWVNGIERGAAPVVGEVTADSPAARAPACAPATRSSTIDGDARSHDQGDVALGLLDAVSDDGEAVTRRARQGRRASAASRSALPDADAAPQAHRARPAVPRPGLRFWVPRDSGRRRRRDARRPGAARRPAGRRRDRRDRRQADPQISATCADYVNARPGRRMTLDAASRRQRVLARVTTTRERGRGQAHRQARDRAAAERRASRFPTR